MTVKIRRGTKAPTIDDLKNFQFGWSTTEKKLYIRDDTATQDDPSHKVFEVSPSEDQILIIQNEINDLKIDLTTKEDVIAAGTTSQYYRGDKTWQTLDKSSSEAAAKTYSASHPTVMVFYPEE
jgi:hypothetical protein